MIFNFFAPTLIPHQVQQRLLERENDDQKNILEEKSNEDIKEINFKSINYFNQLSEPTIENKIILEMYSYLIKNIQYIPIPNLQCQSIIQQHALNTSNIHIAQKSLQYLSFYAKKDQNLEKLIIMNMNIDFLHKCFSSVFNKEIFDFLDTFLKFSPNIVKFCLDNGFYYDLCNQYIKIDEIQLFYNISLIKTAILTFNLTNDSCNPFYECIMSYISSRIDEGIRDINVRELVCYCIAICLVKMPKGINYNILYDDIMIYWQSDTFDEIVISIRYNISLIIYNCCSKLCYRDFLSRRRCSTWIKSNLMEIKENDESYKYHNEIDDINTILIGSLISLLKMKSSCIYELFTSRTEVTIDNSFIDRMLNFLENGNYKMKNISAQFFWELCRIKKRRMNEKFIYPYFISHNIVGKLIDFFDQLDGIPLKSALEGFLNIAQSIIKDSNYNNHPIIIQIRTEDNYNILQEIALNNLNEEIRNLATLIIRQIFTSDNTK